MESRISTHSGGFFVAAASFLLVILPIGSAFSQGPDVVPSPPIAPVEPKVSAEASAKMPSTEAHALTKGDLETWLDGFMAYALQAGDVAGAVVVVVKDGAVLLQKGYGYFDVVEGKPVDAEQTLFRVASVSKLFTWTAVMQLVEQGKLELDTDINTYLDFKIPSREGKPITLRNLLTHTPGFDEKERLSLTYDPHELHSLGDQIKGWTPPRVTAPGTLPAYSNYGAAVAAYIVERVSGEPFETYIERHIFEPLGMKHATFRQPVPEALAPWLSKGYQLGSGEPKPFEFDTTPPTGGLSISGGDMGRFMIAHLQNGAFDSNRILQEATAVKMHNTGWQLTPPLNRMLLGFYENNINGHRVIAHGGDLQWFHSDLNLFIDDRIGLFISLNSLGKDNAARKIRRALFTKFSDRYFPGPLPEGSVDPKTAKEHAQLVAGRYVYTRRSHKTFLSVTNLFGQGQILPDGKGSIVLPSSKGLNGATKKWREIAPFVWRNVDGPERLAAKIANERVVCIGYDELPFMPLQPVPWWWSAGWLLPLLKIALIVLGLNALTWPISALLRRHYGAAYGLSGIDARAHRFIRITSVIMLATVFAWTILIRMFSADFETIGSGMDVWISLLRILTLIVVVSAAAVSLWNVWIVLRSKRKWLAKLWTVALAVSCLTLFYVAVIFHLVGYSANY